MQSSPRINEPEPRVMHWVASTPLTIMRDAGVLRPVSGCSRTQSPQTRGGPEILVMKPSAKSLCALRSDFHEIT